jgi:hypothetical protein
VQRGQGCREGKAASAVAAGDESGAGMAARAAEVEHAAGSGHREQPEVQHVAHGEVRAELLLHRGHVEPLAPTGRLVRVEQRHLRERERER